MYNYPRVLVISNNSISKSSNTGRTMANLFIGWPKDKLAQFCISTTEPDYDVCENFYLLTDRSVLEGFKHLKKGKRCDIDANKGTEGNTIVRGKKAIKTPLKMIARQVVWGCKRWNSEEFKEWVNNFNPEIVLIWNTDAMFILDIATSISKEKNIPIVMYNTEGYYFFDKNIYAKDRLFGDAFYGIFHYFYKRHFRRMMKRVILSVHLNSLLRDDYLNIFGGKHLILYTGSNIKFDSSNLHLDSPKFSYLGNLAFNRHDALIDIAETLQSIDKAFFLDVYGPAPSTNVEEELRATKGLVYHGMAPYDEVVKVMYNSTILFHAETQDDELKSYLRYGFSTKIGDSISSGHPFLMYSSPDIAGAKYVIETGAGWYAKDKKELKKAIINILDNKYERERVLDIARETAQMNHNAQKNSIFIQNELINVANRNN